MKYSVICYHNRIERINKDFVRCLECGQSLVSQENVLHNKSRLDFTKENKNFENNFDRNFSNIIEEVDIIKEPLPLEFYTDKHLKNSIIIDRTIRFRSYPPKYNVNINGQEQILTENKIKEILNSIQAVKIDEQQFKLRFPNSVKY